MPRQISLNPFAKTVTFTAAELDQIRRVAEDRQAPKDRNLDRVIDKRIIGTPPGNPMLQLWEEWRKPQAWTLFHGFADLSL